MFSLLNNSDICWWRTDEHLKSADILRFIFLLLSVKRQKTTTMSLTV